jgi:uncharacterized protein (DUF58 family)
MSVLDFPKLWRAHFSWSGLRWSVAVTSALGLALGCSLASSVAAQEGKVGTAIVLALVALLLAAVISLTVIPRLALRVRRDWPGFSFSVTREGWFCLASLVVLALAALNTANNLIFVIFSAALAALVASELLSNLNLSRLRLQMRLPDVINARQQFVSLVSVINQKRRIASFSVEVEGQEPGRKSALDGNERKIIIGQGRQAHFPFLSAGKRCSQNIPLQLGARGIYSQPGMRVSSRFPFGLVKKSRRVSIGQDLIVLPEVNPAGEFLELLLLLNGAFESYYRGSGSDLYSIRDYSSGENARFLDWKATAKTGRLQLREFTREDDRQCCFVFDNLFENFTDSDRLGFEKAVTLCANAARHFHQMGIEIRLITPESSTTFFRSHEGLLVILKKLALIEPTLGGPYSFRDVSGEMAFKVLFTSHSRKTIPTSVWDSSQVFYMSDL